MVLCPDCALRNASFVFPFLPVCQRPTFALEDVVRVRLFTFFLTIDIRLTKKSKMYAPSGDGFLSGGWDVFTS